LFVSEHYGIPRILINPLKEISSAVHTLTVQCSCNIYTLGASKALGWAAELEETPQLFL